MATSPLGNVVLNTARITSPSALHASRPGLAKAVAANEATASFSSTLDGARESKDAAVGKSPEAFVKFEAMVLQTFLQSILPKDAETVYGGGMAGEMWKSMLAEKLGEAMAERGGIGIADRVLGDYYLDGEEKVPVGGISQGPEKEHADREAKLSAAFVQELQRGFVKAIGEDYSGAPVSAERRR